jgi:hypothetical protein
MNDNVRKPVSIRANELQKMTFPPVEWVIDGLLPLGLTLLAGKPKIGKSWFGLGASTAVAKGAPMLGCPNAGGDVLYCALEDSQRRLQRRMTRVCADGDWPSRLTFWTHMPRLNEGGLEALEDWIASAPNPKLIVIDVLGAVRRERKGAEPVYDYDYESVAPLKRLADQHDLGIVVVHHTRKQMAEDALEEVSGSNGLTGAADTIFNLARRAEGMVLYGRGRDTPVIELVIQFDEQAGVWRRVGERADVGRSAQRTAILAALEEQEEPLSPKEIAEASGVGSESLRQLLGKMVGNGEVRKTGRGLYMRAPTEVVHITHNDNNVEAEEAEGLEA